MCNLMHEVQVPPRGRVRVQFGIGEVRTAHLHSRLVCSFALSRVETSAGAGAVLRCAVQIMLSLSRPAVNAVPTVVDTESFVTLFQLLDAANVVKVRSGSQRL